MCDVCSVWMFFRSTSCFSRRLQLTAKQLLLLRRMNSWSRIPLRASVHCRVHAPEKTMFIFERCVIIDHRIIVLLICRHVSFFLVHFVFFEATAAVLAFFDTIYASGAGVQRRYNVVLKTSTLCENSFIGSDKWSEKRQEGPRRTINFLLIILSNHYTFKENFFFRTNSNIIIFNTTSNKWFEIQWKL